MVKTVQINPTAESAQPPPVEEYISQGTCPSCRYHLERKSRSTKPLPTAVLAICPKCQGGMTVETNVLKGVSDFA